VNKRLITSTNHVYWWSTKLRLRQLSYNLDGPGLLLAASRKLTTFPPQGRNVTTGV
jgi:hypothetical protein